MVPNRATHQISLLVANFLQRPLLRGFLYDNWDGITSGTGHQTRSEDESHFFINLLLYLHETGTFFIPSQLSEITLVQGRIPAWLG